MNINSNNPCSPAVDQFRDWLWSSLAHAAIYWVVGLGLVLLIALRVGEWRARYYDANGKESIMLAMMIPPIILGGLAVMYAPFFLGFYCRQ